MPHASCSRPVPVPPVRLSNTYRRRRVRQGRWTWVRHWAADIDVSGDMEVLREGSFVDVFPDRSSMELAGQLLAALGTPHAHGYWAEPVHKFGEWLIVRPPHPELDEPGLALGEVFARQVARILQSRD